MRLLAIIAILILAPGAILAAPEQAPTFLLRETIDEDWGIDLAADWHSQRIINGIGWELGSVTRGDGPVMHGGFTVVHQKPGTPFTWEHCYVLAAFDIMPNGYLLVTVRDPEYYWEDYDWESGVTDPVELVWYDKDWNEEFSMVLDYSTSEFPDDFLLSPKQKNLLTIRHPSAQEADNYGEGQTLNIIRLRDGTIHDLWLPDADEQGVAPIEWWPVRMGWQDDGHLIVQAGKQIRIYEIQW